MCGGRAAGRRCRAAWRSPALTSPISRRPPGAMRASPVCSHRGDRSRRPIGQAGALGRSVSKPLLVVDTPSMLFRAFYALPKTIVGPGRQAGQRAARRRQPDPARGRGAPAARGRPLLRARRRLLPDRALPRLPRRPPRGARRALAAVGRLPRLLRGLRLDGRRPASRSRPTTCSAPTPAEAEAGGRALLLTGDRDMYQCATEAVTRPLRPHRRQRRRGGRPRRGARALRDRPRRRCPTSSPCAATPPTGCRAPRASARRPPPSCCAARRPRGAARQRDPRAAPEAARRPARAARRAARLQGHRHPPRRRRQPPPDRADRLAGGAEAAAANGGCANSPSG